MKISADFKWNTKENTQLVDAFLTLKSPDETKRFLRDIMTEGEIEEFAKRLEAARLLSGNTEYTKIIDSTGLSSTTIARISKWLKGSLGGYRIVLGRLGSTKLATSSKGHRHNPSPVGKGLSS